MDEFRMPETPSVDLRHDLSCLVHRDTSHDIEARDQIPHPLCMGIKFPTPGKVKAVNARGMPGGGRMLKLRFKSYNFGLEANEVVVTIERFSIECRK